MLLVEIILLIVAYTSIVVTIFLEVLCYLRKIETIQTIAFTVSLLILIIALTVSPLESQFLPDRNTPTNLFTQLAMVLIALTTPLNILEERQHRIGTIGQKILIAISILLFIATVFSYFINLLHVSQYVVAGFLGLNVLLSMLLVIRTKPKQRIAHREKAERFFSYAFMILVPLSLVFNYVFENVWNENLRFGFTLPVVFTILAFSKLIDDLERLSIIRQTLEPKEQHFKNFLLTDREKEIAALLVRGKTYKQISEELFISLPTVKTHASNIYKKCEVNSRHELTVKLLDSGNQ